MGKVFHIELNRPESRNPVSGEMLEALESAFDEASADPKVRVLLLTAVGPAFSAGGGLSNYAERLHMPPDENGWDAVAQGNRRYGRFLERFSQSPKITVAAVQGATMAGGVGLVCAADLSIGMSGAYFGFPELAIGMVPAQTLPFVAARIGLQQMRKLMLTGDLIEAGEAYRIGMIDYLASDETALHSKVKSVVNACLDGAPQATQELKKMLRQLQGAKEWYDRGQAGFLDSAARVFAEQIRGEALEGIEAEKAHRSPKWRIRADR